MLTMIAAAALAAHPPAATRTAAPASQMPAAQIDHSKLDHSKMGQKGDGCCKKGADGKMDCSMPAKAGTPSGQQGHSGH